MEARTLLVTRTVVFAAAVLTLSACVNSGQAIPQPSPAQAGAPVAAEAAAVEQQVPELHLNLPGAKKCACPVAAPQEDFTFLEKGYKFLLDGEYENAMENFQRYQRLESSPRASLEAGLAIAYLRMLPRGPYYNPDLARSSFKLLREQDAKALKIHDYTRLMRQALLNMLNLEAQQEQLQEKNQSLQADLKKREEALKRLRELTLGQKAPAS
jgi:hypothetical protein